MARQEIVFHDLDHHALREDRRVQVNGLLGLQQLRVNRLGRHQKAEAQARRQDLRERAEVDTTFWVARSQRQRRRFVEPQLAIRVVFHDRQIGLGRSGRDGGTARFGHGATGRVLEVGQQVDEAGGVRVVACRAPGLGDQVVDEHAIVVARHAHRYRFHRREGLQRAQVGRRFDQHTAARIEQHLGDQVEALLRAGGDQHLRRVDVPREHVRHDLTQRAVAFAGGVLKGGHAVVGQHFGTGSGKGRNGERAGRGQSACQADDAGDFGQLEDFS